jgi:hypothetical protein
MGFTGPLYDAMPVLERYDPHEALRALASPAAAQRCTKLRIQRSFWFGSALPLAGENRPR